MAKNLREGINPDGDNNQKWASWAKYLQENSEVMPAYYNDSAVSKFATEHGLTMGQARDQMYAEHLRQEQIWSASWESQQAVNDQRNLIRNNQLDSACAVYQRADRIMTGKPVTVFLNDDPSDTPAWNDGANITFNVRAINALSEGDVLAQHGLNYHELAHLLYTPRIGSALGKWVMEKQMKKHSNPEARRYAGQNTLPDGGVEFLWETYTQEWESEELAEPRRLSAFNILEDSRAEHFMTTKFPMVRPYLIATIGSYLASNLPSVTENFMLLVGRKYFPLEVRALSSQAYSAKYGEDNAKTIYNIVAEYRTLVFPRQYDRAMELITKLIEVLPPEVSETGKADPDGQNHAHGPTGCSGRPLMRNGKVESEKAQDQIGADENNADELSGALAGKGEDNNGAEAQNRDWETTSKAVAEAINKAVEQVKADPEVQRKVMDTIRAINKDTSAKSILGRANFKPLEPTDSEITASRLFGQELERIRIDSDPAWELERPTGKLNIRRAMNADVNEIGKLFDRWTTGEDSYEIEATVLLDRSGSMAHQIGAVCRSAWIIKRGIERINGAVSVMTFSEYSRVLYSREEKAGATPRGVEASGGTDPKYALMETERIMTQSQAKTKLVFLLTDGKFNSEREADETIKRLQQSGIYVVVVYLGNPNWDPAEKIMANPEQIAKLSHGADLFQAINEPLGLVAIAKRVVKHLTRSLRTVA